MPSSATAKKAAATRAAIDARAFVLIGQGMSPEDALKQARNELGQKALSAEKLKEQADKLAAFTKKGRRPVAAPSTPSVAAQAPAGASSAPVTGANLPSATGIPANMGTPTPAGQSSIKAKLKKTATGVSASVQPPPSPEELEKAEEERRKKAEAEAAERLKKLVAPTWRIEKDKLIVTQPGAKEDVELQIEKAPGPYTPKEKIHDVLGQPDMLYKVAWALANGENVLVSGPTGCAKTVVYRWFAQKLNWNVVTAQIHGGTSPEDLVGEFLPVEQGGKTGTAQLIKFIYSIVTKAAIASQGDGKKPHHTMCVLEEVNRIGNQQAFANIYSLLDDTHEITIPNKEDANGMAEVIRPAEGMLHFAANMNPTDVGYVGNQDLDVAFGRRFGVWKHVGYPPEEIEAEALRQRVEGLNYADAQKMVANATRVREDEEIAYPLSFPDMVVWAKMLPALGWDAAAEAAVVSKAKVDDREGIREFILLNANASRLNQ